MNRRQVLRALVAAGLSPAASRLAYAIGTTNGISPAAWATGGTASMTGKASYPDPFSGGVGDCALVSTTTAGPCTTTSDLLREDVSEGWTGLPLRLALRIVDSSCAPLPGATVKIWHTNIEGSYSGQTPANGFCLLNQAHATSDFFRGVQTTDDDGIVYFDTCFPGWYPGRAIHIHFQVKDDSQSYRISQLFFAEDVTEDIFDTHSEYLPFGQPDTVFANDGIIAGIPAAQRERLLLDVAQMSDGAMLASKTVAVVNTAPNATATPTETPNAPEPTPTATLSGPLPCVGDCNEDENISVDELVRGVNIALGRADLGSCSGFDSNTDGNVQISELLQAVNAALRGCTGS